MFYLHQNFHSVDSLSCSYCTHAHFYSLLQKVGTYYLYYLNNYFELWILLLFGCNSRKLIRY